MASEGLRPAEAAEEIGVPPSTLRLYSVRFAPLLSPEAARPVERGGGKPGFRLYSQQDLAVLRDGKSLLERGLTYDEALAELRKRWRPRLARRNEARSETLAQRDAAPSPPPQTAEQPAASPSSAASNLQVAAATEGERDVIWTALVASLVNSLNSAQALAEEWRRLVEDRNAEIATLRRRLREAEERARRPWWERLFGG